MSAAIERELVALLGRDAVLGGDAPGYGSDATEARALRGEPVAVALPASAEDVARVVAWCYAHDVAMVPRGGGSGFAGGAVPTPGSLVVSLERLDRVRALRPELWRMQAEAGVRTSHVRRLARENGLLFPPDPGAAEQSQIGGNVATNAGGPHAFKYGTTGAWVTGLEVVVAPGELVTIGQTVRKDVAGYDLRSLLVGSEGTLGIVTAVWLALLPAPEAALPVLAFYPSVATGCAAIERVVANGVQAAALEYLDGGALAAAGGAIPGGVPGGAELMVLAEADGSAEEARRVRDELAEALGDGALELRTADEGRAAAELWRWRDGVSIAVTAQLGGKISEDVVVPLDRLAEAISETVAIGARHDLPACSWGHAGDGNLHSTFMLSPGDHDALERGERASQDLFDMAIRLGGSVSGEHGVGLVKAGQLERQWAPAAVRLHDQIKLAFDPKGLFNPHKKIGAAR